MSREEQCDLTDPRLSPRERKDLELAHNLPGPEVGRPFTEEDKQALATMMDNWFAEEPTAQKANYLKLLDTPKAAHKLMLLDADERTDLLGLLPPTQRKSILTYLVDHHQVRSPI